MLRLVVTVAFAFAGFGAAVASAAPTRKVRIETDPPGATVYVGDKESGPRGETPLELTLPLGEATIILERDKFLARFETVEVEQGKGAQVVSYALEPSVSTLVIDGPKGARVLVDGQDRGEVPRTVEVDPGAHEVQVTAAGHEPFDSWVEVAGGGEEHVTATFGPAAIVEVAPTPTPTPRPRPPAAATVPRPAMGDAGAGLGFGWRSFRYDAPQTANLLPFDASAIAMLTFWAELHPQRALPSAKRLWPLSLVVGFGLGMPTQATSMRGDLADVYWRTAEVGVRWRWSVAPPFALDFEAGWARLLYTFRDGSGALVDSLPDVDYQAARFGLRAVGRRGPLEAWVGAENRVVVSGGVLADRFARGADATGVLARIGGSLRLFDGHLVGHAEGTWSHYGWTFTTENGDAYIADGASDTVYGVGLGVGGSY